MFKIFDLLSNHALVFGLFALLLTAVVYRTSDGLPSLRRVAIASLALLQSLALLFVLLAKVADEADSQKAEQYYGTLESEGDRALHFESPDAYSGPDGGRIHRGRGPGTVTGCNFSAKNERGGCHTGPDG